MTDKIVATSKRALLRKYGPLGFGQIWIALQALIAADQARGIVTTIINIDSGSVLNAKPGLRLRRGGAPGERATKLAINAILRKYNPAYLMILGGPDVVCHQKLNNPMFAPPDDDDANVPSDLPYASQSPYTKDIIPHLGPTHVVGRLPDMPNATSAGFLVRLIKYAATARTIAASNYRKVFGVSAEVWQNSTQTSLSAIFGGVPPLSLSPPTTPPVARPKLRLRSHFINCHGGTADFHFYGQRGTVNPTFPVAVETPDHRGHLRRGCVASVECCFGAELYDPALSTDIGLCCCYLEQGAHGVFGSTNIAYGPAVGNGNADYITQFFLQEVAVKGASLGRACLNARHRFLQVAGPVLSPVDLKTIAQFLLLGDPSIHPAAALVSSARSAARAAFGEGKADEAARIGRREELAAKGAALPRTLLPAKAKRKSPPAGSPVRRQLLQLARELKMERPKIKSFGVSGLARPAPGAKAVGALSAPPVIHVMLQTVKVAKRTKAVRALIVHQYGPTLVAKQDVFRR